MASSNGRTSISSSKGSLSSSQLLSASMSSTTSPRHGSQISKIYRQSSTLFLTRRLPESLSTLLPVITAPTTTDGNCNTSKVGEAPIAGASRTTRIKVWSLYLTILNAIVELGPEDGKAAFGTAEWRSLVSKVNEGKFWEEVVQNGYRGVEGNVDADVVINLATLLLAHAPNQKLNQTRLEAYLAASTTPNLDISSAFDASGSSTSRQRSDSSVQRNGTGTSTPRDLNARVKILELYTLHVLLRNNEWDYARDFISASEVLDDERREAFLNALQSLEDEMEYTKQREIELQEEREKELQRDLEEAKRLREENEERERLRIEEARSERARSEVDYGVEAAKARPSKAAGAKKSKAKAGPTKSSISAKKGGKVAAPTPSGVIHRAGIIINNLKMLISNMSGSFKTNPLLLIKMLAFVVGLLLIMGNQRVKNKLRGMMNKVKATAGMGVKVSYI